MKQKYGIELVDPNVNMSKSMLNMAKKSIEELENVKTPIWIASISYYIFYYSLYSLMLKFGVKCEIHSCSLKFMENFLMGWYDKQDLVQIKKAFSARNNLQYYSNRPVDSDEILKSKRYCKDFFIKTKNILLTISNADIESLRDSLSKI